jgi:hypothetical protein
LGAEGTLDVYATNSINLRTRGDINLHADRDINMFAGGDVKIKAQDSIRMEADVDIRMMSQEEFKLYSKTYIGIKSDGTVAIDSGGGGSWLGGPTLQFTAGVIDLNGPAAPEVNPVTTLTQTVMDDTKFSSATGWEVDPEGLGSIVTRAPTHEPYPYHNKGVDVEIALEQGRPPPNPSSVPVPAGVEITRKS